MSTILLVSSSPPRAFARSPTPAESSSPLPSPGALFGGGVRCAKRFKSSEKPRDGFSTSFTSARSLLSTRVGAENIPLGSPGRDKFKLTTSAHQSRTFSGTPVGFKPVSKQPSQKSQDSNVGKVAAFRDHESTSVNHQVPNPRDIYDLPEDEPCDELMAEESKPKTRIAKDCSPLHLEQAIPRRLDWTPAKSGVDDSISSPETDVQAISFSRDILQGFVFADSSTKTSIEKVATKVDANGEATKRRRIDLVTTTGTNAIVALPTVTLDPPKESGKGIVKKRNKSPPKKALTITGLATSHYGEGHHNGGKIAPMLEYLTATQVNADSDSEMVNKQLAAKKAPVKKSRVTKKAPAKSRLRSPTSVMKTVDSQELVFGSASQLARDESPTLLRDTLEAIKRSECILSSDPISPPRTQPVSVESTSPSANRGTSRFVRRKNLWSAAGRDEDNALLHVDTIDLIDSPAVREALAGKDVLLQPGGVATIVGPKAQTDLRTHETPLIHKAGPLLDIDDIATPYLRGGAGAMAQPQARSFHTSRVLEEPRKRATAVKDTTEETTVAAKNPSPAKRKAKPAAVKPSYAGFSTGDLQKQISAYGFKAVKSRDKMIELLNRCWEDQHPGQTLPESEPNEPAADAMTHGDFLSKVHDVAARPEPKVKKPRAKRKSETSDPSAPKEPKKRKKAEPKPKDAVAKKVAKPRKPRTTTTKKAPLSEEIVMDVDDIDDDSTIVKPPDDAAQTTKQKTPKKRTPKAKSKTVSTSKPATPPPTLPVEPSFHSSSPVKDVVSSLSVSGVAVVQDPDVTGATETGALTPQHTPVLDLKHQIRLAIESQSSDDTIPTWREKILMYDPIVLEDLTVWLNTKGFAAISEDREIAPLEVRAWCEENGVCCLWKGGWRGNRKAGGE
ncbi:5'-flap endonuclease [Elasticomyces elasticus]|uniref:Structure-specific endonuclease subunit SLX4 n=1 Tax=Exophiala sideris TaxID=1016849 RepID=A0ABR0IXC7_9EURO|nr:5'-flap endonuclease [Elasticomyces elasticus]KAK5021865.1 5'-flap endonuclease [Exophiala sideris]KAK5025930.1 5'-flap endonuclease [Exophiala sideris]KAK5050295.1 5'-flap endonuclease [Exophiala sideris]KAK5177100.1 5'-flap endonuclease [Eurotiomycetes sp. CCFEE 6388]